MNIEDVLKLVRPNILGLEAYSTARDDCGSNQPEIFLDANENPYNNGINRYPDPHQKALKAKVAEIKGISADSLFIGKGELATSNAQQVRRIREIVERLGLTVATPAEARERLGLKGGDKVGF